MCHPLSPTHIANPTLKILQSPSRLRVPFRLLETKTKEAALLFLGPSQGILIVLDIIESYLNLRLLADCLGARDKEKPSCAGSDGINCRASETPFRCFNVTYGLLDRTTTSPVWKMVSFSLACHGYVIHAELHHKPPLGPETLLLDCEPQLSLERNEYRLQEMLPLRRYIENEILPAIHAELSDSLIASPSPTTPPPCLAR
ncbi:hypothetical protein AAHC03_018980 [Spirometra sp. Aus1]